MANTVNYEILKSVAVLGMGTKGWKRELNIISWNGAAPKFDIRDWDPAHTKMGKGIVLSQSEAKALMDALVSELSDTSSPIYPGNPFASSQSEPVYTEPASQSEPIKEPAPAAKPEPTPAANPTGAYNAAQLAAIERARAMMAAH